MLRLNHQAARNMDWVGRAKNKQNDSNKNLNYFSMSYISTILQPFSEFEVQNKKGDNSQGSGNS